MSVQRVFIPLQTLRVRRARVIVATSEKINHIFLPMRRYFLIAALLLAVKGLFAFQLADSTQKNTFPNRRYIFYWSEYQCDLTPENGYRGRLEITAGAFRRLLLYPPKMWTGSALMRDFTFKLEQFSLSTADYTARLGELDAALGPGIKAGAVMHVSELPAGESHAGSVDVSIGEDEEEKKDVLPFRGNWTSNSPFLNERLLENVAWGREDITKMSDRDFFTVSEFWQTVRQQPYAEWQASAEPQTIRAIISFQSPEQGSFSLSALLSDDMEYRQMLNNLNNYKHLARPGNVISLELQTARNYERLYKKQLTLVADNDARLLLRRSRDTHNLQIEWGNYRETLDGLYLSNFTQADGKIAAADGPIARTVMLSSDPSFKTALFGKPLICRIDGEPLSGVSFRLGIAGETYDMVSGEPFGDSIAAKIAARCDEKTGLQLDSFHLAGVDLPPLYFDIRFTAFRNPALVRNDLDVLLKTASESAPAELFSPLVTNEDIQIRFSLPKEAFVMVSIFEPNGRLAHLTEERYAAGQHRISVPRGLVHSTGKHFVFLNTPFGVVKKEMELK